MKTIHKKISLIIAALALGASFGASADDSRGERGERERSARPQISAEQFAKVKQMRVSMMEETLGSMQKHLSCVKASTNHDTMRDCDKRFHEEHRAMKEKRRAEHDKMKEELGFGKRDGRGGERGFGRDRDDDRRDDRGYGPRGDDRRGDDFRPGR